MADTIQSLISRKAKDHPDAVAVETADLALTYAELEQQSDQLCAFLRSQGVVSGALVASYIDRSVEFILALLATLKAGATFIPLSAEYPPEQLERMLIQSRCGFLLITSSTEWPMPRFSGKIIRLGGDTAVCNVTDAIEADAIEANGTGTEAENGQNPVAFIIFTSGSTGQPKGVMETHTSFCYTSVWHRDVYYGPESYGPEKNIRVLLFGAIAHGNVLIAIVGALTNGATLCIATLAEMLPGPALARTLDTWRISHVHLPPTSLAMLPVKTYSHLRVLSVGGEKLAAELAAKWISRVRLLHIYGATETNWATLQELTEKDMHNPLPVGPALRDVRVLILGEDGQPVAPECQGELCIGGPGLAQAYINLPEMTKQRFVSDPILVNECLYRTGDIALQRADGTLVVDGRIDHQIKIRNFLVDLIEVEQALIKCTTIDAVAVVAHPEEQGMLMTAFIVSHATGFDPAMLRVDLQSSLPHYMIPSRFRIIDSLPMLANGKCDRKTLLLMAQQPLPVQKNSTLAENFAENHDANINGFSNDDVMRWLIDTWQRLLGADQMLSGNGKLPEMDFFAIGGNSLQAGQVIAEIEKEFGIAVTYRDFFRAPKLHDLALLIRARQQKP